MNLRKHRRFVDKLAVVQGNLQQMIRFNRIPTNKDDSQRSDRIFTIFCLVSVI